MEKIYIFIILFLNFFKMYLNLIFIYRFKAVKFGSNFRNFFLKIRGQSWHLIKYNIIINSSSEYEDGTSDKEIGNKEIKDN